MAVVPHPVGDEVHLHGDVSYAVILFSALSYFVQAFGEGSTWQASWFGGGT